MSNEQSSDDTHLPDNSGEKTTAETPTNSGASTTTKTGNAESADIRLPNHAK